MDSAMLTQYLAQIPYFQAIDSAALSALAAQARLYTYEAEQTIFLEGEPSAGLWLVESGNVKVSRLNQAGTEYILHLVGPGESFNDISALDQRPNPATAAALTLTSCWCLPTQTVQQLLNAHPAVALAVVAALTARVRGLVNQIESLALQSVPNRLAHFLLQQAADPSLAGAGVTRAAIAAHLATTPETISRVLSRLQAAGAIRFDRHRILITDAELLRTFANE